MVSYFFDLNRLGSIVFSTDVQYNDLNYLVRKYTYTIFISQGSRETLENQKH